MHPIYDRDNYILKERSLVEQNCNYAIALVGNFLNH